MISDIKLDVEFTIKESLVDYSHTTAPSSLITYSSYLSRDRVRILFLHELLNYLEIFVCDIVNS